MTEQPTLKFSIRFEPTSSGKVPDFAHPILKSLKLDPALALETQDYEGPEVVVPFSSMRFNLSNFNVIFLRVSEVQGQLLICHSLTSGPFRVLKLGPYIIANTLSSFTIEDMKELDNLGKITHLALNTLIKDLSPLQNLRSLTQLNLSGCESITDLSPLQNLLSLTQLDLGYCRSITDLSPLQNLQSLTQLDLGGYESITDLSPLQNLRSLTQLNLGGCESIPDLSPLQNLQSLTQLDLSRCPSITDLSPLQNLQSLTQLNLGGCESITDLSPLQNLQSLTQLDLSGCKSITDLSPLQNLRSLTQLNLGGWHAITDLSPLQNLQSLTQLDLDSCSSITDLRPISNLRALSDLTLTECELLLPDQILYSLRKLPMLSKLSSPHPRETVLVLLETTFAQGDFTALRDQVASGWKLIQKTSDLRIVKLIAKALSIPSISLSYERVHSTDKDGGWVRKNEIETVDEFPDFLGLCLDLQDLTPNDWAEILTFLCQGRPKALQAWLEKQAQQPPTLPLLGGFLRWIAVGVSLLDWPAAERLNGWLALAERHFSGEEMRELGPSICLAWRVLGEEAYLQCWIEKLTAPPRSGFREKMLLAFARHDVEIGEKASALRILREMDASSEEAEILRHLLVKALAEEMPKNTGEVMDEILDEEILKDLAIDITTRPGFLEAEGNLERLVMILGDDPAAFDRVLVESLRRNPDHPWLKALREELLPGSTAAPFSAAAVVATLEDSILSDYLRPKDIPKIQKAWQDHAGLQKAPAQMLCAYLLRDQEYLDEADLRAILDRLTSGGSGAAGEN